MRYILLSFIGIAINIWIDTLGIGGGNPPDQDELFNRDGSPVQDRAGDQVYVRAA